MFCTKVSTHQEFADQTYRDDESLDFLDPWVAPAWCSAEGFSIGRMMSRTDNTSPLVATTGVSELFVRSENIHLTKDHEVTINRTYLSKQRAGELEKPEMY